MRRLPRRTSHNRTVNVRLHRRLEGGRARRTHVRTRCLLTPATRLRRRS